MSEMNVTRECDDRLKEEMDINTFGVLAGSASPGLGELRDATLDETEVT